MNNILGNRLRKLREKENLSQKRAASIFGITNHQLSRYETGKANPDPDLIAKFADYYDVSSDYIIGRTNNPMGVVNEDGAETDVYEQFLNNDETLTFKGVPIDDDKKRKKILKLIELELEEDIEKWEQKKK